MRSQAAKPPWTLNVTEESPSLDAFARASSGPYPLDRHRTAKYVSRTRVAGSGNPGTMPGEYKVGVLGTSFSSRDPMETGIVFPRSRDQYEEKSTK